jgi:hypothetical protein
MFILPSGGWNWKLKKEGSKIIQTFKGLKILPVLEKIIFSFIMAGGGERCIKKCEPNFILTNYCVGEMFITCVEYGRISKKLNQKKNQGKKRP